MVTPLQLKLLNYLREYSADKGYMPTMREMAIFMGYKSFSRVSPLLVGLERRKKIRRMRYLSRAIEIIQ